MAVETLKEGIQITATNGNVLTFKIEVDTDNNKYTVVPTSHVDPNGNRVLFSNAPVFIDDVWQQNFNGFNIDDKGQEKLQTELNDAAVKASALYYFPTPAWAKPGAPNPFINSPANANQTNQPDSNLAQQLVNGALTGGGTQQNLATTVANLAGALDPNNIKAIGTNDKYKAGFSGSKLLVYPLALKGSSIETHRDTCVISMFNYVAPNQDEFFTSKSKIFEKGLTDSSNLYNDSKGRLKEGLGKVILPMPQSFEEKREVQYGEDTMNTLAAGVTQDVLQNQGQYLAAGGFGATIGAVLSFLGNKGGNSSIGIGGIGGAARTAIAGKALATGIQGLTANGNQSGQALLNSVMSSNILQAAGINVSAETILARGAGIVPNPNMELLFRSPLLRNFGLAYRLTARSESEAKEIREIIRFFKQGMSPRNSSTGNNFFIKTPNVFGVEFKTTGQKRNRSLPKFKVCALRGFSTDYSPDKMWAAYDDGQPVSVTIVLEFGELTPIYSGDFENLPEEDIGY